MLAMTLLNGCAGLVTGSSSSANLPAGNPGTPAPGNMPQAQLSATPGNASFPNVGQGTSSSQMITVLNTGAADATISNATVTGAGFSISGLTVPAKLAAGQGTSFKIVFSPSTAGSATGSVSLMSDAPGSPLTIAATGTATAATALLVSNLADLNFGDVLLGNSSSMVATLTNSGNTDVLVSSVAISGAEFTATGLANGTTIAPGQTASLNANFTPTTAGTASGLITITSNSLSPVTIPLAGNGAQASTRSVALNWDSSTSPVVGYNVYRAVADGGYAKINSAPAVDTQYVDGSIQTAQMYTYVVTAIDADNVESEYSDPVVVTIP
jgi:hypothetical protein